MWDELYVRLRAFSASAFALRATPDKPAGQEEIRLRVDVRLRRPSVNRSVGRTRRRMPLRLGVAAAFAIVVLVSMSLHAQWPRHPTAGAPRAQGGRV